MKKRILSIALILCTLMSLCPLPAAAAASEIVWLDTFFKPFDQGVAVVMSKDRKYGLIDKTGKTLLSPVYDSIFDFSEGLARIQKDGKYGYVDATGKVVVAPQYDNAGDFSEGMAWVKKDGLCGFIDATGKVVIPLQYETIGSFSEGLAPAGIGKDEKRSYITKTGYIDKTGKLVIPMEYFHAFEFKNGVARVSSDWSHFGAIDKTGRVVVPLEYDGIYDFSEGIAKVEESLKYGYVDMNGREIVPPEYTEARDFSSGIGRVRGNGTKYFDATGKEITFPIPWNVGIEGDFIDGIARIRQDSKYGFMNKSGDIVIAAEYDAANDFADGMAVVKKGGKFGAIDRTGKVVVPIEYDAVNDFSEGVAVVQKDKKYGFVDKTGRVVVPLQYNYATSCSDGVAQVRLYNEDKSTRYGILRDPLSGAPASTPAAPTQIVSTGIDPAPTGTAHASTQVVDVAGKKVTLQAYKLTDGAGGETNYVKVRDVADALDGTAAQFNVGWSGTVDLQTGVAYTTRNGQENKTPYSGDRAYTKATAETRVNGVTVPLQAFVLRDDNGGESTYYKLRDLGQALGFNVGWSAARGIFIETDKPYDPND